LKSAGFGSRFLFFKGSLAFRKGETFHHGGTG